ncbi:MAG: ribbon-helix-helix protein, CopG family [Oscillospiraceae bacterium]
MDKQTLDKLDDCCKAQDVNKSEFVRRIIHEKHDDLKK